jgi:hypothetical protein
MTALRGGPAGVRSPGRDIGASTALEHALLGVLPVLVSAFVAYHVFSAGNAGIDFRREYWVAGWRLLHGGDVYYWTHSQIAGGDAFPYPALWAVLLVPFALIPSGASVVLFVAICLAAAWGTLRVLGVRDWRVYGVILVWAPVIAGWQTGNLTLLLGLGIALVWRYRDRPVVAGLLIAVLISVKTFMWPLALWLLVTRRYRAFTQMMLGALVLNLIAWVIVGPAELHAFLSLSSSVSAALYRDGYGVAAFAADIGFGRGVGIALEVLLSLSVALACLRSARRGQDHHALTLTILLMLLASPLVWNHYFALIMVPLAIARPRFGWVWLGPVVLLVCPDDGVHFWQLTLTWIVVGTCFTFLLRDWGGVEQPSPVTALQNSDDASLDAPPESADSALMPSLTTIGS